MPAILRCYICNTYHSHVHLDINGNQYCNNCYNKFKSVFQFPQNKPTTTPSSYSKCYICGITVPTADIFIDLSQDQFCFSCWVGPGLVSNFRKSKYTGNQTYTKGTQPNMTASGAIRIWWDDSVGAYRVVTPYNAGFVQFIKDNVPVSDRVWDPSTKIWTIAERFFTPVKMSAETMFRTTAQVVTKEQAQRATAPPAIAKASLDSVIIQFFKLLPQDAVNKAYRQAAMMLHPDHGGTMDKMSSLNALWSRLKEEMWKQTP